MALRSRPTSSSAPTTAAHPGPEDLRHPSIRSTMPVGLCTNLAQVGLQERRDAAWCIGLDDAVQVADVNTEFQGDHPARRRHRKGDSVSLVLGVMSNIRRRLEVLT